MFEVKGVPILVDEVEVLKELRRQVYEQQGREILKKIKISGDNIMICCPIHNDGQEKNPSCGVALHRVKDRAPGTVHCFACGYTDSLEGMITKAFGYNDIGFGINWLLENFVSGDIEERPDIPYDFSRDKKIQKKINYVTEEELSKYRFYHPYMFQRKLTKEVIEKYDVGYQKDFVFNNWKPTEVLTFPVKDEQGNCLFVSRRAIYGKTFFLPPNIDKPVYGLYELPKNCQEVVICESVINALTSVVYGKPALALFGTGADEQYIKLNELPIRHYVLALDPDKAGQKGVYKLKKHLRRGKILTKLVFPEGKDLNDLSREEYLSLPEIFI